jgi:hypothetical protein
MLSTRLIRRIEEHAEDLTREVLQDLASNARTPTYHRHSRAELHARVYDVYHNLGRWLGERSDEAIEMRYASLGRARRVEATPLSEVIYALILVKEHLRGDIRRAGIVDSAVELYQEEELHRMIGHFFDKAIYFTIRGYETPAG